MVLNRTGNDNVVRILETKLQYILSLDRNFASFLSDGVTWLRLVQPDFPSLVKQRYGIELRSNSLASLKPEISQALDSLLEDINNNADAKIVRSTASKLRQPPPRGPYNRFQKAYTKPQAKSCPFCKQAGRNDRHFLSQCTYLPAEDRAFLAKARLASSLDDEDDPADCEFFCPPEVEDFASSPHSSTRVVSCRVSTKQSPHFNAFYHHNSLKLVPNQHDQSLRRP